MRAVVDGGPAADAFRTGVGTYAWNLLRRLPEVDPSTEYVAWYVDARSALGGRRHFEGVDVVERPLILPSRVINRTARFGLPLVDILAPCDVVFGTAFVPPPARRIPSVVTIHDLAFRLFPTTAPHVRRWWLGAVERSVRAATTVIVPSHATYADLLAVYDVDPDRVRVIPMGVDRAVFSPVPDDRIEAVRRRFGLDGPFVVALGRHQRKNVHALLRAFAMLPDDVRPTLVVTGDAPWTRNGSDYDAPALAALPAHVRRQVSLVGYVSHREAAALLSGSEGLAFPTLYEGFGFPALEAMACGTPVLTSATSSLPELVGDAAILVDPRDDASIADGLHRLLTDGSLRRRLRLAGFDRAGRFDWDATARTTAEVLHGAGNAREP